jgi:hypothetical protein
MNLFQILSSRLSNFREISSINPLITDQYLTGWYKAGQKLPGVLLRTRSTVIDLIFVCHRGELSKNPGNRA